MLGPAYRIETSRLVLRCWSPRDAPALEASVHESLEHLRPWMTFVQSEPEPIAQKVARLRRWRADFDSDRDFVYGVFPRAFFRAAGRAVWGGCALHPRGGLGVREIGYWLNARRLGRGLAQELSAALTQVAFELEHARRVEIQCDPRNLKSARVPEVLGFLQEATPGAPRLAADGVMREVSVWCMDRAAYELSPAARVKITAYSSSGERLGR